MFSPIWKTEQSYVSLKSIASFGANELNAAENIYGSTRIQELEQTNWDESQKEAFIRHQFLAQHEYYQKVYPDAWYGFIYFKDEICGRLYLNDKHPTDMRIIDIALLPEFRNQNLGTSVLKQIQTFAAAENKTVSIHVEQFNPAKKLYERLGFEHAETYDQVYILMKWSPINL